MLKPYAEKFGIAPGWQFLTGKEADITLLRQKLGLLNPQDPADQSARMACSLVIRIQMICSRKQLRILSMNKYK